MLDALYEHGCDDALVGRSHGVQYLATARRGIWSVSSPTIRGLMPKYIFVTGGVVSSVGKGIVGL